MFARKRKVDLSKPPPKRRKSKVPEVEEISFDFTARQDYLTGFHKRKLQRAKHAKEQAVERERLEKIEARKRVWHSMQIIGSLLTLGLATRGS